MITFSRDDESSNPYRSPQSQCVAAWPVPAAANARMEAVLVQRGWLYRRVRLFGGLDAEVEWNGRWPMEFVCVNGRKVAEKHAFFYVPHFAFELPTSLGLRQVTVDLRISLMPAVKRFQISVNDQVVYLEGS